MKKLSAVVMMCAIASCGTEKTMEEYQTIVFKVIPIIIVVAALLFFFIDKSNWRAISISTIAMMVVIMSVDINAHARLEAYHEQLISVEKNLKN